MEDHFKANLKHELMRRKLWSKIVTKNGISSDTIQNAHRVLREFDLKFHLFKKPMTSSSIKEKENIKYRPTVRIPEDYQWIDTRNSIDIEETGRVSIKYCKNQGHISIMIDDVHICDKCKIVWHEI